MNSHPQLPLVIEPADLYAALDQDNLLIVDLACKEETYLQGHVPGAVYLPSGAMIRGEKPAPGMLPTEEKLKQLVDYLGITADTHLIVYDDEGGGWAGRMIWTLDVIGHDKYSYLNGGIHAWIADGFETQTTVNMPFSRASSLALNYAPRASKDDIIANLENPNLVVWDARSPGEYSGEKKNAARAGHIPGAVNFEWTRGMDSNRQLRIRDLDELRSELSLLGITADKEIVTHCQTHHRSGFTYLLGKVLGFPSIRAYDGSWSEWGNDPNTPVETNIS